MHWDVEGLAQEVLRKCSHPSPERHARHHSALQEKILAKTAKKNEQGLLFKWGSVHFDQQPEPCILQFPNVWKFLLRLQLPSQLFCVLSESIFHENSSNCTLSLNECPSIVMSHQTHTTPAKNS
jgi:hypothetical protein